MTIKYQILSSKELEKTKQVVDKDVLEIFKAFVKLEDICKEKNLNSLSASQIGVPLSFFVFKRSDLFECYLNCCYTGTGSKIKSLEQCVSVLDKDYKFRTFEVERFSEIAIKGKRLDINNLNFIEIEITERGKNALIFQHEIDHSNGFSIDQIGKEITLF